MFASPGIVPTGALLGSRRSVSSVATGADGKGTSGESVPGSAPGTPLWPAVPAWPPAPRSLIPGAQPMSPIPFPRMSTMAATGLFSPETPTSPGARPVARSQSFAGPARTAPLFAPSGPSSPSSIRNGGRWLSTTATPRARPPTGPMAHSFAPGTRLRALEEDAFESDSTVGSDEEDEEDEEEEEAAAAAVRPASMAPPQVAALLRHPPPDSEVVASTNSPAFRRTISRLLSPADLAPPASLALLRARHRNVSFVSSRGTSLAGSGSMSLFLLSSPECSSAGEESEPDDAEPTADTTSVSSFKIHTSLEADDRPVPGEPRDAPAQAMAPGRAPGFVMALSPRSESSSPVEALPPAPGPKPEPAAIPAGPSSDLPVFEIAPAEAAAEASGPATPALFVSKETHPRAGLPRPPSLSGSTSGNLVASRGRRQWGGIARMSLAHLLVSIVVAFLVGVALAAFNSRGLGALVGSPA